MSARLATDAAAQQLDLLGIAHDGDASMVLLGPREPDFWPTFTASPEYVDGAPDPLDRWSHRVIGALAQHWGGVALFPSDGPPFPPFIAWALASGTIWTSPVGLLVHERQGLWLSFRGAVRLPGRLPAQQGVNPCTACPRPCETTCPVGALTAKGYDVAACHAHLDADDTCLSRGCATRRACPVGRAYGRREAQSRFHMKAFHPR